MSRKIITMIGQICITQKTLGSHEVDVVGHQLFHRPCQNVC